MKVLKLALVAAALVAVLFSLSCGGDAVTPSPTPIGSGVVTGDGMTAAPGPAAPQRPVNSPKG